jgi:hypothetical protein
MILFYSDLQLKKVVGRSKRNLIAPYAVRDSIALVRQERQNGLEFGMYLVSLIDFTKQKQPYYHFISMKVCTSAVKPWCKQWKKGHVPTAVTVQRLVRLKHPKDAIASIKVDGVVS